MLVLDTSRSCLDLELLDAAACLIAEQSDLQPRIAVAATEEQLYQTRRHRQVLSGKGIVDIGNVQLDGTTIRACAVLAMHRHFTDAGLFDAIDRVIEDAVAGTANLDHSTVLELKDYALEQERRWPSLDQVNALQSRLFDDAFDAQWTSLIRTGHDFIQTLTPEDIHHVGLSSLRAESVRGPALKGASLLTDRASATVELVAGSLVGQIVKARAILHKADIRCEYGARDWRGVVVATTSGLTQEDVQQRVKLAENTGILMSWLATRAKAIGDRQALFIRVEDIVTRETSDDPFMKTSDADAWQAIDALYTALDLEGAQRGPVTVVLQGTQPAAGDGVQVVVEPAAEPEPVSALGAPSAIRARVKLPASMFPNSPVAAGG